MTITQIENKITKLLKNFSKENFIFEFLLAFGESKATNRSTQSIIIPLTSSERRKYIPLGYINSDTVVSNSSSVIYDAEPWIFSIITSKMHMIWMRTVAGRLKTDYSTPLLWFIILSLFQKLPKNRLEWLFGLYEEMVND